MPDRPARPSPWVVARAVSTVGLLTWLGLELWLFAGAARGPGIFAARLAAVPSRASWLLVAALAVHVVAFSLLVFRRRDNSTSGEGARWIRLADRAAALTVWGLAAVHLLWFWGGAATTPMPFDAWVRLLGATPGGIPLVAFGYLLGFGACAYATTRVVVVAERRGSKLAIAVAVALGAVVFGVGANAVVAVATGAGWAPPAPAHGETCSPS